MSGSAMFFGSRSTSCASLMRRRVSAQRTMTSRSASGSLAYAPTSFSASR